MENGQTGDLTSGRWVFVGEQINVSTRGEISEPVDFIWRAKQYHISQILLSWFDWNFPAGAKQRNWKSRRHRRYYRVITSCGKIFEIYYDRKSRDPAGQWVCYQRWEGDVPDAHVTLI